MTKKSFYTVFIAATALGCYFGFYHSYNYEVRFKPKQHQSVAWFYLISDIQIRGIRGCHNIKEMEGDSRLVNSDWFQCESEVTDDMDALYGSTLKLRDQKEVNPFPNSAHEHYEHTWAQPSAKEAEETNRQLHDWAMEQYTKDKINDTK